MADANIQLYFDAEYKLRVFDPKKYERSEQLEKECGVFVEKIGSFNDKIHGLVEVLEAHAKRIDDQKLKVRMPFILFDELIILIGALFTGYWFKNGCSQ